jgi:hypothetical protein
MIKTDMTNKQFDFSQVGKRMSYTVPEGFFDEMEKNVMAEIKADKPQKKARTIKIAVRTMIAAAAAIALFLVVTRQQPKDASVSQDYFAYVELAYNNLSSEDQEYLQEIYEEDVFLYNEESDF